MCFSVSYNSPQAQVSLRAAQLHVVQASSSAPDLRQRSRDDASFFVDRAAQKLQQAGLGTSGCEAQLAPLRQAITVLGQQSSEPSTASPADRPIEDAYFNQVADAYISVSALGSACTLS